MPDIWTHIIHGSKVGRESGLLFDDEIRRKTFNLGNIFMNIFFYSDDEEFQEFGRIVHTRKCGSFLNYLSYEIFKTHPEFIYGMVCHHWLDRLTYPYIFDKTVNKNRKKFEEKIDEKMVEMYFNKQIQEMDLRKFLPELIPDVILDKTNESFNNIYLKKDINITGLYENMLNNYMTLENKGHKRDILKGFRKVFFTGTSELKTEEDFYDVLNLKNQRWNHPIMGWTYKKTFLDIYEESVNEAINSLSDSIKRSIQPTIYNISYFTNLACTN